MNSNSKFVTSINCMDGRVQLPVIEFLMKEYNAHYVDMITEAGPNKILAEYQNFDIIDSIKARFKVSTEKHESKVVAIVGHYDCGGNPAADEEQIRQINAAVEKVSPWNENVQVIGLWVDSNWHVNRLEQSLL